MIRVGERSMVFYNLEIRGKALFLLEVTFRKPNLCP